jgi:hypothetical protein
MKHLKTQKQLNEGQENLNISDVISRDSNDIIWDILYNMWHKHQIENINHYPNETDFDKTRIKHAKEGLIPKETFINRFKESEKFATYWSFLLDGLFNDL